MPSFRILAYTASGLVAAAWPAPARAQQHAQGFDVERLYTSAPGAGWFVMDALDMHGGLGGAASADVSYAHDPLRITNGHQTLAVVSDEAFLQLGFAGTYDRFRIYATFDSSLLVHGTGGTLGGYVFTGPSVDLGSSPDAVSHARIGVDTRVFGRHAGVFRLGVGLQLWFPGGAPGALSTNYLSDGPPSESLGAYNAMVRVLFAGDVGLFTYAGQIGFNLRSVDDAPTPGSPQGSEALFGGAGGVRVSLSPAWNESLVVGPEVYGETAVRSLFGENTTGAEALLSGRVESTAERGAKLRFKLGIGAGLDARFGAPEWRTVIGIELFDQGTEGSTP